MNEVNKYGKIKEHIIYTQKNEKPLFLKGMVGRIVSVSIDGSTTTLALNGIRVKIPTTTIERTSKL